MQDAEKENPSKTYQKAKVIETEDSEGNPQKKAITEDGEVIYLGFSKS